MSDEELLRMYATGGSEESFTELVRRHAGAVQAAAVRQTSNAQLAEDVTHAVFLQLARKAGSIRPPVVLLGWLLRAARYAAIDAVRAEVRRQKREADFITMQTLESTPAHAESESLWLRVAPLLDEALLRLREADRNALLLRFFENKPLAAVGAALGVPEDAARKRVQRALERLHLLLLRRGALAPATLLPALLSTRAAPASKAELVHAAARTALATAEPSASQVGVLAAALGRRFLWCTLRPWLIGATVLIVGAGSLAVVSHERDRSVRASGIVDDDYRVAGFPDAAVVRRLVAELQKALGADRRQGVADLMRFPLRVNALQGTGYVQSEADLLARFDALFSPQVIGIILKSPNRRLFCNASGVMVGDGTVWIGPAGQPTDPVAQIIALNLP